MPSASTPEDPTQISEGGPRGWAAATGWTGGARGCAAPGCPVATNCRSGSAGVGDRMAAGAACARQIAHRAQLCAGWAGACCAGCPASSTWQIGTLPSGSAATANGASEIVASRRIWHQTASNDAANPIVGCSPEKAAVGFRSGARRTGGHSICHGPTPSLASCRGQAAARPFPSCPHSDSWPGDHPGIPTSSVEACRAPSARQVPRRMAGSSPAATTGQHRCASARLASVMPRSCRLVIAPPK